ncbi:MAG: hypothetical protein A2848_01160 [Candidatus Magasanikbacteria bacterium RIFCSPHIGHO2_01_FULL_50_8]|uniref:DUF5671 domain-containing protein n=2 Tax=Candidatus Magasanikiibacteriota TaxID=1752731 RepID=A0A1F6LVT0_9BACT|nr:MAG: hypothetical protein A2848_01160 [Candidatus Magasanikbacteria bacterium RIFCSPHIGHO2_01_FULL_50_8]OGH67755.1 MAG: hypothetical protein A3C15_03460 [Candidatus Magasanikbacteria bacterium RIFCSPHIGHO2_02_FULL_50_9b]
MTTRNVIRNIYLYLVSAVSLFLMVFALASMINLGLRTWLFPKADDNYYYPKARPEYCMPDKAGLQVCPTGEELTKLEQQDKERAADARTAQRQRDLVQNISMLIVAAPLFGYHWRIIRRDRSLES